ncbi:G protein-coupled receptor 162 [Rhinolophus ferrumequinum]|uniref:G protein-coupled receptor 162 n=1 Tax=Rhinolophus ferrumequinum TaxID=59479 RepID=A0A7J7WPV1_RHIFE|nr:probable G-protein coupled receptor 162 isoform X2 [Rhinolophus ferrumequinum]KAF6339409.1 G protein-coupled receptor 162 [Rhinolophus ferrumequinum]
MARGGAGAEEASLRSNALSWLACGLLALLANAWIILSISAKQQKHKPLELLLCFLAGTHILMAAVPLTTFAVVQLRRQASSDYDWNESICKVFVSTYYTLALATCFTVASLSYHRMWMVVSFFSLKSDSAPPWMVLAVLWCSMAQTLLLPSFIWSCERYRADVRTVWEQCVAIMSEEDGDDDGGCDDYADGRMCKVRFDANGATGPGDPSQVKLLPGRHMLFPPLETVHYLQVPLSRRLSHDETNIFSTSRAPTSFLHKWSSSDDIRVLPAQSRALGGPPEYLGQRQRLEDEEDDEVEGGGLASLRQFLEGGILGSGGGPPRGPGFFREEITTFIDETPLPSPTASPGPSPRRLRPLGFSPRRLSLGSPDSRAIGLPLGLSAGRRCSLTGGEGSTRAWGGSWGPGNPIFPQLTL